MGEKTGIEWTDATWNPWMGCLKVSPGCKQCYMYRDMKRYGRNPKVVTRSKTTFNNPLKWAKGSHEPGTKIFTCSWSDWFIEQADEWRDEAWDIIRHSPFTYQILTKRTENIPDRLPHDWGDGWPNVWLGVSVETSAYYDRLWELAEIPAAVRFISYEPALGPVDFAPALSSKKYQWLISGGESGYDPRPAQMDWFREARDVARWFSVAYFHKQHGGSQKVGGAWGGRLLDGRTWSEFPTVASVKEETQLALF
jgi:protein gp37